MRRARITACAAVAGVVVTVVVPGAATAVPGTTLFVDRGNSSCSDTGSGTATQPFCTIGAAAIVVSAGQTVQVAAGTYPEDVTVSTSGTSGAAIVFTAAAGATVTLSGQASGFTISGRSWISVNGFNITNTSDRGIYVSSSSHITISDNHVSYAGKPRSGETRSGIYFTNVADSLVAGNTVDHNTDSGIHLTSGSTRDEIRGNITFSNAQGYQRAATGIRLYSSPSNTVDGNITHDNEDSGIECYTGSKNTLLYDNVAYNNGDHGIDNYSSTGQRIVANTVYNNVTAGINLEQTSTGATIANNISVDNGINSPRTHSDIRVESGSTTGTTMDYDLVHVSTPDTLLIWKSISYASLASFRTATGQELHGINADPKWAGPAAGNFHLTAGSPAIDSANSGASGQPSLDAEANGRYDDPATPNTGAGPRAYDDRGAYEFQSAPLDHIVVAPSVATIDAGGSQAFTAQAFDASGKSLGDVTGSTTFTIAPNGSCSGNVCTATVAGTHTVTGTSSGKTSTASLTVNAGTLDHLALSPASATIAAGGSQSYTAQGRDRYDNSLGDITSSTTFTIFPDGSCAVAVCTASTGGVHTVTGTAIGATGSASLTVTASGLDHIVISPASATITAGSSQAYTAQGFDAAGNALGDVTAATTFSVAPDGSCSGSVCSVSAVGAHTVTGNDGGKTSTASLSVVVGPLDHLLLSPASASIVAGGSSGYTAQGFDAAGNSLGDVTASTTFTIAPNGSCSGNTCTATVAGAHTVTGNDGGKTGTASLTVNVGPLDHLVLSPASATIGSGGSQAYTAMGFDQYSNSLGDITATTTFTIAPDGFCTAATCTASSSGAHTVMGTSAGKTATASLQVSSGTLDHIVISPSTATTSAGDSRSYTAEGFDAGGASLGDVSASTTFTIAPDGSCSGNTCTATVAGAHTVAGNDGGKTSTASLSVNPGPLDHLALSPASATISPGGSQAYTAQGRDRYNNSLGDITSSTTFTIAPNGSCTAAVCTASTTGAHTVTGTALAASGNASLQVNGGGLDHITLSPASAAIQSGASQSYTATGFDAANNSLGDVTASTTFSITPDGSCSGNVCTASVGGLHTVTGTDSGKNSTATLSVNFVKNSGFETDLTGWNTSGFGTGITVARVAGGHSGGWAAQLTNTNTTNQSCGLNDSPDWTKPTTAGTYTGTIWVRADQSGAPLKLRLREYTADKVTLLGTATTQVTLTGSWQQVSVSYTVPSPGSTLDFNAYLSTVDSPPGNCFYADDAEIYKG